MPTKHILTLRRGLLVLLLIILVLVIAGYRISSSTSLSMQTKSTHVLLIGASIGQGWRLTEWPSRMKLQGITAESLAVWDFDKTEAVKEVLMRPARPFRLGRSYLKALFQPPPKVPDIVILKECSAYFPGDIDQYRRKVTAWVEQLRSKNIVVVLATVVPVTSERGRKDAGKQESLLEYNRWVREYTKNTASPLLDLEAALRAGQPEAFLDRRYAVSDGSHLNQNAYSVLDAHLRSVVCAAAPAVCASTPEPRATDTASAAGRSARRSLIALQAERR
jgi:hypothetical protein